MADSVEIADGGGKFTSTITPMIGQSSWGAKDQRLDPFLAFRTRYDQALEQLRVVPGAGETAVLCWGGTAHDPANDPLKTGVGFTTRKPADEPKEPDDRNKPIKLTERLRIVEKIKVRSEADSEVSVTVERMRAWFADGSDGKRYVLVFHPAGQKIVVAEGAPVNV